MSNQKRSSTLGATLAGLSLAFAGLSSIPVSASAQVGTVDGVERILNHFHCYEVLQGQSPLGIALLQDQFDRLDQQFDLAFVSRPFQFCNPAEKQVPVAGGVDVTPIVNPNNHLTFHLMLTLPPGGDREVVINNQFGEQRLRVRDWSFLLAVPTWKNREGDPPSEIDHFKCHFVTAGEPVQREARLFDQFFPNGLDVKVNAPRLLCNPTRKIHPPNNVGVFEPDAHLACYQLEPTPFQRDVRIDNQFVEAGPLTVGQSAALCVPSLKKVVDGPLPDLIPLRDPTNGSFCRRQPGTGDLLVEVGNIGAGNAGPSTVTVDFIAHGVQSAPIPGLAPGASANVLVPMPPRCFDPDCEFRIIADSGAVIGESNETNNAVSDLCLG